MTQILERLMLLPRYASDGPGAIKPGFDRISALLAAMDHPERSLDVALVAGTNGKGSTASMMSAYLSAGGYRTGLHTSPHLIHVSERMRVDGKRPPESWLQDATTRFFDDFTENAASFFEATLALSLLWFAEQNASHAVVEVGLGGRLDATNVLSASVSVITGVALDHMDILGDTIAEIALEKAGIIKPGKPVIVGAMPAEAEDVVRREAYRLGSPVIKAGEAVSVKRLTDGTVRFAAPEYSLEGVKFSLLGAHQLSNAATALAALHEWVGDLEPDVARNALENVAEFSGLRGRTEILRQKPLLMVDVAHNPDAVAVALGSFLSLVPIGEDSRLIIGLLSDKDVDGIGKLLAAADLEIGTVSTKGARGMSANALCDRLKHAGVRRIKALENSEAALSDVWKNQAHLLVLGSHLVVADMLSQDFGK